jgi:hypothetical protein
MNKSSRTIAMILSALARLEADSSSTALDAIIVLDEIRRLRRKWDEQVKANSPRRIERDFREMAGWLRRWAFAADQILAKDDLPQLRIAIADARRELETGGGEA